MLIETAKELVKRRIKAKGSSCNSTIFQRSSVGVNLNVFTGISNAELQARINIMYLRYSNVGAGCKYVVWPVWSQDLIFLPTKNVSESKPSV